jgi:quinohemoprotein ethanol dehydrogenase
VWINVTRRYSFHVAVVLLSVWQSALQAAAAAPVSAGAADGANWITHGGGDDESSFSRLDQIDTHNVGQLGLAWSLDLPREQTLEATPLAVDGVLYFTGTLSTVYAVEATTGRLLWRYDPRIAEHMPDHMHFAFGANRGAAYAKGKIYVGSLDGRLIALDARSGKPIWITETVSEESKQTITGAPRVFKGKVLIGNGGADVGARGYVTAYDQDSGKQLWRFYTVPTDPAREPRDEAMQLAAKTWGGEWWKVSGGGGTVWDGITYDPQFNRVYIGVGNSGPYNPRTRSPGGGDNLFLASIVALDADTGRYLWHYQVNPLEAWDYKATANMITATLRIAGKARAVLMQSPTNGFFYVLDRVTGRLISAQKIGKVTWADHIDLSTGRPVEAANIRYENGPVTMWPSPFGAHNWQSMSYSPRTGLVYIPYMQLGARYTPPNQSSAGGDPFAAIAGVSITPVVADENDGKGALLAWDPVAQRSRWRVQHATLWNGGTLATAGDLVFQGDADGQFSAYEASSGRQVWSFSAKLGIVAAPMTYQVHGRQYVSVLVGYGGATAVWSSLTNRGWKFGLQPRRLLTFRLGGSARLPDTPPPDFSVHALDIPELVIDKSQASAGARLYAGNCSFCHGGGLLSAGAPAPDLRESPLALNLSGMTTILKQGTLAPQGMPRFGTLSDGEISSLYMYIRAGAREALGKRQSMQPDAESSRF